uniref:hypothetical protein n=1 Tax=Streptomyces phytophilus TaxID=722715 RepID=UPI0015F1016C
TARELDLALTEHRALTALAAIAGATGDPERAARHTAGARLIERNTGYHPCPEAQPGANAQASAGGSAGSVPRRGYYP